MQNLGTIFRRQKFKIDHLLGPENHFLQHLPPFFGLCAKRLVDFVRHFSVHGCETNRRKSGHLCVFKFLFFQLTVNQFTLFSWRLFLMRGRNWFDSFEPSAFIQTVISVCYAIKSVELFAWAIWYKGDLRERIIERKNLFQFFFVILPAFSYKTTCKFFHIETPSHTGKKVYNHFLLVRGGKVANLWQC